MGGSGWTAMDIAKAAVFVFNNGGLLFVIVLVAGGVLYKQGYPKLFSWPSKKADGED